MDEASVELDVAPHGGWEGNVESLLGRFADGSWAYRFGPPAQDLVVLSLERAGVLLSQAFRFPAGRPSALAPASRIGLAGAIRRYRVGAHLRVTSDAFAYGVRVHVPATSQTTMRSAWSPARLGWLSYGRWASRRGLRRGRR